MRKIVNKRGFTIIELIIVILILSTLAVVFVPKFYHHTDKVDLLQIKNDVGVIANSVKE